MIFNFPKFRCLQGFRGQMTKAVSVINITKTKVLGCCKYHAAQEFGNQSFARNECPNPIRLILTHDISQNRDQKWWPKNDFLSFFIWQLINPKTSCLTASHSTRFHFNPKQTKKIKFTKIHKTKLKQNNKHCLFHAELNYKQKKIVKTESNAFSI